MAKVAISLPLCVAGETHILKSGNAPQTACFCCHRSIDIDLAAPVEIPVPAGGSITFITAKLPLGTAFDEVPCTHLFNYPDLGIAIINGFAAEQKGSRGTNVAVLVDPGTTDAPEIAAAQKLLPPRRMFVRGYSGRAANVSDIAAMVENFPYDFLIFATHSLL